MVVTVLGTMEFESGVGKKVDNAKYYRKYLGKNVVEPPQLLCLPKNFLQNPDLMEMGFYES